MDVRLDVFENLLETLKKDIGDGLLALDVWAVSTGLSLVNWQTQPAATALFNQVSNEVKDTLEMSGFPPLKDYYYMDLTENRTVVVLEHGSSLMQGWLMATDKVNAGVIFGVALPKAIRAGHEATGTL